MTKPKGYYTKKGIVHPVMGKQPHVKSLTRTTKSLAIPKRMLKRKRRYGRYDSPRVFYEQCQKIAKEHPKWDRIKVEAEATIRLSGIGQPDNVKEKRLLAKIKRMSAIKGVVYAKELDLKEDIRGHIVGGKDSEALSSLLRKGDVYSPREGMYKPTEPSHTSYPQLKSKRVKGFSKLTRVQSKAQGTYSHAIVHSSRYQKSVIQRKGRQEGEKFLRKEHDFLAKHYTRTPHQTPFELKV